MYMPALIECLLSEECDSLESHIPAAAVRFPPCPGVYACSSLDCTSGKTLDSGFFFELGNDYIKECISCYTVVKFPLALPFQSGLQPRRSRVKHIDCKYRP